VTVNMTRLDRVTPFPPPVGTRCFYKNDDAKVEGWGVLAEPIDNIDAEQFPDRVPWRGTLTGPSHYAEFPNEVEYRLVDPTLSWVPEEDAP